MRSQSPGMAKRFRRTPERRLQAFARDNLRSRSPRAAGLQLAVTSGSNVRHTTCRRLLFRLLSTRARSEVLALQLLLALESSCVRRDAGVGNAAPQPGSQGDGRRKLDQQFYIGIGQRKIA